MNAIKKICFVGLRIRIVQYVRAFPLRNNFIRKETDLKHNQLQTKRLNLFTGIVLAFIWPLNKTEKSTEDTPDTSTQQTKTPLEEADNLFENGRLDECYEILIKLESDTPNDVEINWRITRALYNLAKDKKYDTNTRKNLITTAFEIISVQLENNSNHHAVQKWYALLLDSKSSQEGIKERIKQLQKVKKHMDIAVSINPNDATTLYMLGEWCYQVTELPWHQRKIAEALFATPPNSSYEDALEYFLKAETAQPRFYSLNLLRLGNCYLKLEKEDQAKYYLKLAASYPAKSNDDHRANKEAAELLKKMK